MTTSFHITAGIVALLGGVVGSQALPAALADLPVESWVKELQGPFGALIGLSIGLWWMKSRLDKAEAKNDKRDDERDADRKTLIEVVVQNSTLIAQVKEVMEDATEALKEKNK